MKSKLILLLTAFFLCSAFKADKPVITIFMIGDSTMSNKSLVGGNPERGWENKVSLQLQVFPFVINL